MYNVAAVLGDDRHAGSAANQPDAVPPPAIAPFRRACQCRWQARAAQVRVLPHVDLAVEQFAVCRRVIQQVHHPVVLHRQRLRYATRLALGHQQVQTLVSPQWPVRVEVALRRLREARVIRCHKGGRIGVGVGDRADAAQPQFLHQPVLQCQVRALDAALGRTVVRPERVDVQLVHRAAELRHAATSLAGCRAAKHAHLVAVQSDRLAMLLDIRARRLEVAERRFARREMLAHQPVRRVVDVHRQRAGRSPLVSPPLSRTRDRVDVRANSHLSYQTKVYRTNPAEARPCQQVSLLFRKPNLYFRTRRIVRVNIKCADRTLPPEFYSMKTVFCWRISQCSMRSSRLSVRNKLFGISAGVYARPDETPGRRVFRRPGLSNAPRWSDKNSYLTTRV